MANYDDHANGEENIFFPIANEYLNQSDWQIVKAGWN